MKRILSSSSFALFVLVQLLLPTTAIAERKGVVNVTLEWHTGRLTYFYVFSGVVSRQGSPVPNATVKVQIHAPGQPELVEETVADDKGSYELKVKLAGVPEDAADWKLIARAAEAQAEAAEVEGRTILTATADEAVTVQRPIQLVQG